jgi:hypothetical protein
MPDPTSGFAAVGTLTGFSVIGGTAIIIALVAGLVVAWTYISSRFTQQDATELGLAVAVILSGVITVMLFVCMFCSTIHPTERFVGTGDSVSAKTPTDTLLNGIADAEQKVCELIQRTDKYIESDVGKPGQDDPSLVVAAQRKARVNVPGGTLVDCTVGSPEPTLLDADGRLTLLENTLKWFTGPELEATYKKSMAGCEGFSDGPVLEGFDSMTAPPAPTVDLAALQKRLDTIMSEIADQHRQYLNPMDKQTERLNRGEVSDCQKKMGANAGADAAAASKRPPPGTPMSD